MAFSLRPDRKATQMAVARGRRSAASYNVVALPNTKPRVEPRDGCPAEIAELFREIVASVSRDHFRVSDEPLIEQFCQAVILARLAYASLSADGLVNRDGRASAWNVVLEKAHRSSVA